MAWAVLIPTIIRSLYELYKILQDMHKSGVDIKACKIEVKENCQK